MCSCEEYKHNTFKPYYFGFRYVLFPVNTLSKKNVMRRGKRKLQELKVRRYAARLIDLNKYLAAFPGAKASDNIGEMEINGILLKSMPNGWSKQAYVQGFYCETITLKIC